MARKSIWFLLVALLVLGCEERAASSSESNGVTAMNSPQITAPEVGGPSPGGFRLGAEQDTDCTEEGARHLVFSIRAPNGGTHLYPQSVRLLVTNTGGVLQGALPENSVSYQTGSTQDRWLACEARAGRQQTIEIEFCPPTRGPVGVSARVVYQPADGGHSQRITIDGTSPQITGLLQLVAMNGSAIELMPVHWRHQFMDGHTDVINMLHLSETPNFIDERSSSVDPIGVGSQPAQPPRYPYI